MSPLKQYMLVSSAYWSFMLTDGALRMICLLHFYERNFSPVQLAMVFVLYEVCGLVTNAGAGWLAQNKGLRLTLLAGLSLQVAAIGLLSLLDKSWGIMSSLIWVILMQALSGIAKDLTKMSSKSAIKYLLPQGEEQSGRLFKWVAILTGSKNAIKGFGYFLGGFLLQLCGFRPALWIMGAGLLTILIAAKFTLPQQIGKLKGKKTSLKQSLQQPASVKKLSLARFFLFGARDIWFAIALPLHLASSLNWSHTSVGTFMALWIIAYGAIQAFTPLLLKKHGIPDGRSAMKLALALSVLTLMICIACRLENHAASLVLGGLCLFGPLFALNSSVHSFLIVDYADGNKAASSVGFYYMANAGGRLVGTIISGFAYQYGGIEACLSFALAFCLLSSLSCKVLPRRTKAQAA